MTTDEEAFLKRLLATFRLEAEEHLKSMSDTLRALQDPQQESRIPDHAEVLFREAHSLKGAARSVDLLGVEGLCHVVETALARLRHREINLSTGFFDVMYRAVDQLGIDIDGAIAGKPVSDSTALRQAVLSLCEPESPVSGRPPTLAPPTETAKAPAASNRAIGDSAVSNTVRISTGKLESLFIQIEELMAFKFSAAHVVEELRELHGQLGEWRKELEKANRESHAFRQIVGKAEVGGMVGIHRRESGYSSEAPEREKHFVSTVLRKVGQLERQAESDRRALSAMFDVLLDEMKQALMLPFSALFEALPRMVRDLARECGKEVELVIQGDAINIDRRIQEQIKTPLIHLLRNAVDHGLEKPAERIKKNKRAIGRITLNVTPRDGNKIELTITDDGAGLDLEKIKEKALELRVRTSESLARLNDNGVMELIFESGLSTSKMLTDVSGRGLGMAIVREKIEKIGGVIEIDAVESGGTRFRIVLPATLATFRGVLVEAAGQRFILPSLSVESVRRVAYAAQARGDGRESISLDGAVLPLRRLADILRLEDGFHARDRAAYRHVVVLFSSGKRCALAVDAVIEDQDILVKSLGPQLVRVPNVSAATILEGGKIVPILNVQDLMKSSLLTTAREMVDNQAMPASRQSLLVVEDSVTSRFLMRNILESAGYSVTVAADGVEALSALQGKKFDLVVSDVEMPRMDGFSLTAHIRSDRKLRDIPVVLVTTLDSAKYREQGLDAGANAYISKGTFNHVNLLETIRSLI